MPRVADAGRGRRATRHPALAVAAGTGDNMAAALGLGLEPGDVRRLARHERHGVRPQLAARRPTPPAACSPSRMPRAASCRSSAPSTPRGSSRRAPRCSAPTSPASTAWRWPPSPAPGASPSCPTSTASAPRTCPSATGRSTASPGPTRPRRTSPGRSSRGCCSTSPRPWMPCAASAARSSGCSSSAAPRRRRRCSEIAPTCSGCRSPCRARASTSPSARRARRPGRWPVPTGSAALGRRRRRHGRPVATPDRAAQTRARYAATLAAVHPGATS